MKVLNIGCFWGSAIDGPGQMILETDLALKSQGVEVQTVVRPTTLYATMYGDQRLEMHSRGLKGLGFGRQVQDVVNRGGFDTVLVHSPEDGKKVLGAVRQTQARIVFYQQFAGAMKGTDAAFARGCDRVLAASTVAVRGLRLSQVDPSNIRLVLPGCRGLEAEDPVAARKRLLVAGTAVGIIGPSGRSAEFLVGIEAVTKHCSAPVSLHLFANSADLANTISVCQDAWGRSVMIRGKGAVDALSEGIVVQGEPVRLAESLAAMDILLVPGAGDGMFDFVAASAMGLGIPVVAFPRFSIGEVVADGGELALEGGVKELGAAVERLALNAELRRGVGEMGRTRFDNVLSSERFGERLVEALYGG